MDNRAVQDFYTNQVLREAVREYILNQFQLEAIDKVFKREDVSHVADAVELLDKAFSQMQVEFAVKKEVNKDNPAR